MKTTTITRITPEGAQLTDGTGRAIRVGDIVATSAALSLATPDGSSGCVSVTAPLLHPVARGRYVAPSTVAAEIVEKARELKRENDADV